MKIIINNDFYSKIPNEEIFIRVDYLLRDDFVKDLREGSQFLDIRYNFFSNGCYYLLFILKNRDCIGKEFISFTVVKDDYGVKDVYGD